MLTILLHLFIGIAWASLTEYLSHRFLLHHAVRKSMPLSSLFAFHTRHHGIVMSRELAASDPTYDELWFRDVNRCLEVYGLVALVLLHLPVVFFFPWVYAGSVAYTVLYYTVHLKMHVNPGWGWHWFPWHMVHHFTSARKNFGVVTPIWDLIFRTYRRW